MFKVIHTADIHLSSRLDFLSPQKARQRRAEILTSFISLVDWAKANKVDAILLCGDIFDGLILERDLEVFTSTIKNASGIKFLYISGNHSNDEITLPDAENFLTFSNEWTSYTFGNVVITSIEVENWLSFYDELKLSPSQINIVMLHGQVSASTGKDLINLKKLQDKNIDYLALGHIHSYKEGLLPTGGKYAYCGCLEGRGFDELGEKGFVLLEIDEKVNSKFIPFSKRQLLEIDVDLTGLTGVMQAMQLIEKSLAGIDEKNLVCLNLKGEISFDVGGLDTIVSSRQNRFFYFKVKNMLVPKLDIESMKAELSLRGEFVREVLALDKDADEKMKIIQLGLKALGCEEVEL